MVATRDDVARRAGVSVAVVSYVVNNGPRPVAAATRERVLRAIDDLGYRPNAIARSLRMATTNVLGLVVPDISNPFFAELALSVENAAFESGYSLFLGNAMHQPDREQLYMRTFAEHQVAGVCLIGDRAPALPSTSDADELPWPLPVVLVDRAPLDSDVSLLVVDNEEGGRLAALHLLGHGYPSVACLAGPRELPVTHARTAGWRRAHRQRKKRIGLIVHCKFDRHDAYNAGLALLSEPEAPHALFVQSDEQAIGVLHAAAAMSVRIPDDLAIVSFDGIRDSSIVVPPLTTIEQPFDEIGRRAVEILTKQIADHSTPPVHEVLGVSPRIRRSCGC